MSNLDLNPYELIYKCPLPYPPVQVNGTDAQVAAMMLDNFGGSNSEMSAVALYLYNHLILEPNELIVAQIFYNINLVEMKHLEIFGSLARQLGADPRLWSENKNGLRYWTGEYNQYPQAIRPLLINALNGELAAIAKYESQIALLKDQNISYILERIILDEQLHVEIFHKLLKYF